MSTTPTPTNSEAAPVPAEAPTCEGRFSTGETAASYPVRLTCTRDGLEIRFDGEHAPRLWPYEHLTADAPLKRGARDALLSSALEPAAHLFITDAAFLAALRERAVQLSPSRMRRAHARPWIAATLAVVLSVTGAWLSGFSPASLLAQILPDRARIALGEQAVAAMVGSRQECRDEQGTTALNVLAARLASGGSFPHFDIIVVDWDLMNAFAVPGDKIVLTRGLLKAAEDPDEVAGVLAHEMGHGLKRHPEAAFVRALGLAAAAEVILGGSGGTIANIGIVLAQLSYSRANEREADETALTLLRDANVSAQGFGHFFDRVLKEEGGEAKPPASDTGKSSSESGALAKAAALFRSHPPTEERRRMVAAAAPYPATPALTKAHWTALKAICGPEKAAKPKDGT